jgi:hypothetical protein
MATGEDYEEVVPAAEIGTDWCHLCETRVKTWRKRVMHRRREIAYGYYCPACCEHVWGLRGPLPEDRTN